MPGFSAAPRGIRLDTPEQIRAGAQRVCYNVVTIRARNAGNNAKLAPTPTGESSR